MKSLTQFNNAIRELVNDLKAMKIYESDIAKMETYIEVLRVHSRSIIRNFQTYFLKDTLVLNILNNNVDFFIDYDCSNDVKPDDKKSVALIHKIQSIIRTMKTNGNLDNINKTFDWMKILCYHAYADLNIDPVEKFKALQSVTASKQQCAR